MCASCNMRSSALSYWRGTARNCSRNISVLPARCAAELASLRRRNSRHRVYFRAYELVFVRKVLAGERRSGRKRAVISAMPNLPSVRQRVRAAAATPGTREIAQQNLTRAFMTFTQAAGSLENSYTQLQTEVGRLHQELQRANLQLDRSLEENARMRGYLSRVLESLPCGVLVAGNDGATQIINPEARRLLQVPAHWTPGEHAGLPVNFEKLIANAPKNSF